MSRTTKEVFANMTDSELSVMYYMNEADSFSNWTFLISLIFGYFLVAYFAGKQLSRIQVTLVSILYSWTILMTMLAMYGSASFSEEILSFLYQNETDARGKWVTVGTVLTGWLLSLVFMYQTRTERDA